jgi:hypothetical protein
MFLRISNLPKSHSECYILRSWFGGKLKIAALNMTIQKLTFVYNKTFLEPVVLAYPQLDGI